MAQSTSRSSLPRLLIASSLLALLLVAATAQPASEDGGAVAATAAATDASSVQSNLTAPAADDAPPVGPSELLLKPDLLTDLPETSSPSLPQPAPAMAPAPPLEGTSRSSEGPPTSGPSARQSAEDATARRVADFTARAAMEEEGIASGVVLPGEYLVVFKTGTRRIALAANRCVACLRVGEWVGEWGCGFSNQPTSNQQHRGTAKRQST